MATILVVDDEKPLRQFLVAAFEEQGHRVLEAWHGRQALKIIAANSTRPDLVISDVMMPIVGGVELCLAVKSEADTAGIPFVLMSAAPLSGSPGECADAVIGKPFDLEAVMQLVGKLLGGRRP